MIIYIVDNTLKIVLEGPYAIGDCFPVDNLWPVSGNWVVHIWVSLSVHLLLVLLTHSGKRGNGRGQGERVPSCWLRL